MVPLDPPGSNGKSEEPVSEPIRRVAVDLKTQIYSLEEALGRKIRVESQFATVLGGTGIP